MHGLPVVAETQFACAIWQMKIWTWDRPQRPFVSASVTTQFVDDFEVILNVGEGGTWGGSKLGFRCRVDEDILLIRNPTPSSKTELC